jgi:protocatechuate 3,4-dioxygenase beta subunit
MKDDSGLSRRQLFGWGSFVAGVLTANSAIGQILDACGLTPPQTEGPFYPVVNQADKDTDLTQVRGKTGRAKGQVIYIQGQVVDEHCGPVPNALVEIWQACWSGRYHHPGDTSGNVLDPNFQYWGRASTDAQGNYQFKTIIPGAYKADTNWWRPPHIHYKVHALGYHDLTTQMYFAGNQYNDADLILQNVPAAERDRVIVDFAAAEGPQFDANSQLGRFDIALRRVSR